MKKKPTEERQAEIKSAVLDIIKQDGIHAVSTSRLAKTVGLSEGAIFKHFKTKHDIILSIIDDVKTDLVEPLQKIATTDAPPQQRLRDFIYHMVSYFVAHRGITILLLSEASGKHDKLMLKKLRNIFELHRSSVGIIIKDGMAQGIWDKNLDVDNITFLYMGIPSTINIHQVVSNSIFDRDTFCQDMIFLIERMLKI